jgi:hypothetical protein
LIGLTIQLLALRDARPSDLADTERLSPPDDICETNLVARREPDPRRQKEKDVSISSMCWTIWFFIW